MSVQVPVEHDTRPWGRLHVRPQAPQLVVVLASTSQPLVASLSQLR